MKCLVILLALLAGANAHVLLRIFPYAYLKGEYRTYRIPPGCTDFSSVGKYVASVQIVHGSCIKLYSKSDCTGSQTHIALPDLKDDVLPENIYHSMNAAQLCAVTPISVVCPNGTFVRRVDWSTDNLRSGITIYCYEPGKRSPTNVFNTHGKNLTLFSSQVCTGAARGLRVTMSSDTDVVTGGVAACGFNDSVTADYRQCDKTDALVGITVYVEEYSGAIKAISAICRYVEDPVLMCTPTDDYHPIVVCDNTHGTTETQCQYSQTVGVGISKTLTVEQTLSLNFYGEFGFTAGGGAQGLSAQFAGKLGFSITTGFDWTVSTSVNWNSATTVNVGVATPVGVITTLEQVVGHCSFYDVFVNYFKRVDRHGSVNTTQYIAQQQQY